MPSTLDVPPSRRNPHLPASVSEQHWIFADERLSPTAKILAVVVLNRQALRLGACTLTTRELGACIGASERQARRALAELRQVGWLREIAAPGGRPRRRIILQPRPRMGTDGSVRGGGTDPSALKVRDQVGGAADPAAPPEGPLPPSWADRAPQVRSLQRLAKVESEQRIERGLEEFRDARGEAEGW